MRPPAQDDRELIRDLVRRIRALETKNTMRIGPEWLLTAHPETGDPVLLKPGVAKTLDGTDVALDPEVIDLATRGFVTKTDAALAVSGGKTKDIAGATQNQIDKDAATDNAQVTADNAYAVAAQALAQQESGPGGASYNDSFEGPQANDLGPEYDMVRSSGPNQYGTSGNGTARNVGGVSGSTNQTWMFRRLSLLNTAQQRVSATWVKRPVSGQTASLNAQLRLAGRVDQTVATGTIGARWHADIENDRCRIGYFPNITDPFVDLTGWQTMSTKDGDSFDFWIGLGATGHDRFKAALLRNNLTVAMADDIPENTVAMLANRQCAVGVRTAVNTANFLTQTFAAPELQAVNFADRT